MERRDIMNGRKLVGKNEIQTYEREKRVWKVDPMIDRIGCAKETRGRKN